MSDIDHRCHQIAADLAAELLALSPDELLARPKHEAVSREVDGRQVWGGIDRYQIGDDYHIGIQLVRHWFWFIKKTYVDGVVLCPDSPPRRMTPLEADEGH